MSSSKDEEELLRSHALQNVKSILLTRKRAEEELIRAQEKLRANAELLRITFEQAAIGIASASLDGRFLDVNRRFSELLGYGAEEIRTLSFQDVTHPDDAPVTDQNIRALLAGEIREFAIEKRYRRKDGGTIWSLTTVTLVHDADGKPLRFVGVIEDISKRRAAEDALREETRVLELLNRTGTLLASQLELDALLQSVTDAATEVSGAQFGAFFYNKVGESGATLQLFTLSGASRDAFERFGHPRATPLFGPTFRGEGVIRVDDVHADPRYGKVGPHHGLPPGHLPVRSYLAVSVIARSGEVIGGLFFGHPDVAVFNERTERLVASIAAQAAVAIDNARLYEGAKSAAVERARLLESERTARTDAERASAMKDEFLAIVSHELRTPLNAILGWAILLRVKVAGLSEVEKGVEIIERNAKSQAKLIDDLLDVSRIMSGKMGLDVVPVTPVSFIEAAIDTVRPAATAKQIRLDVVLDRGVGPIIGDGARLQQVLWNLLSNAIKFTPRDGKVQVLLQRVDSHIEITVADTGIGIEPEFMPHVFERFRQADGSPTRRHGGLGLGLAIVKHLIELHGGSVEAYSEGEGHGATFILKLPLPSVHRARRHESTADATPVAPVGFERADLSGLTVLVVDDERDASELVAAVLGECGATVREAANADEAIALFMTLQPDVLVSDIGMPGVDGYELLRRIRALPLPAAKLPAIALTAFARAEDRTRALRAGFWVHLAKPIEPSELVATVASVAGRWS